MTLVGDELAILRPLAGATASSPPPRRAFVSEQTLTEPDTAAEIDTTVDDTGPADAQPEPAAATAGAGPAAVPGRRRSSGRSRSGCRTGKASGRRIADKAMQVADTDQCTRALAAELTGARSAGIADLTTAITEAKRSPVQSAIADLAGVQSGTVPETTVHLVGMGRSELQTLVQLVGALSDVQLPKKVPAKSTDAALALVEPVRDAQIDADALEQLQSLLSK